jgi:TetR/AcrR family transcriptional repressor of bet genes
MTNAAAPWPLLPLLTPLPPRRPRRRAAVADIARAAGVTTGALAHYFPDKDAVLAAALEEVCGRLARAHRNAGRAAVPRGLKIARARSRLDKPRCRKAWRVWLAYWGRAPFSEKTAG